MCGCGVSGAAPAHGNVVYVCAQLTRVVCSCVCVSAVFADDRRGVSVRACGVSLGVWPVPNVWIKLNLLCMHAHTHPAAEECLRCEYDRMRLIWAGLRWGMHNILPSFFPSFSSSSFCRQEKPHISTLCQLKREHQQKTTFFMAISPSYICTKLSTKFRIYTYFIAVGHSVLAVRAH